MIVVLMMGIFVSLALIQEIFNQQSTLTDLQPVGNESIDTSGSSVECIALMNSTVNYTLAEAPSDWKAGGTCPLAKVVVSNTSGTVYTANTDYIIHTDVGILTLLNSSNTLSSCESDNTTYVTYEYCEDGYNTGSGARGVARIIGIFTVLSLAIFVAFVGIKKWLQ